ncbi:GNAT family N-acetyltransferase [Ilumatobacter sp.]|uniref:GNAT family N-acetyltransferase n=1 Tax=Ilumatobacter sp. TaxID=1967498 RepID=UPI003B527003
MNRAEYVGGRWVLEAARNTFRGTLRGRISGADRAMSVPATFRQPPCAIGPVARTDPVAGLLRVVVERPPPDPAGRRGSVAPVESTSGPVEAGATVTTAAVRASAGAHVRLAGSDDAEAMRSIYNHEVENFTTTMDMVPRDLDEQRRWIAARTGAFSAIVAEVDGSDGPTVVGFASVSPFRDRPAYSTTVESSVYVARDLAGRGIGRALMEVLIERAGDSGFHSMIARIESSGAASLALHGACGFRTVGVEREVGRKHGRWLDVVVMQLLL